MLRKMFQGGSSKKQGPRIAMRDADEDPPRDALVRPCEWPSENFMGRAGIKEEFKAYLRNAGLEDFEANKCPQYNDLTSSFVRRFEYSSSRNSPSDMFDLYANLIPWTSRISLLLANFHHGVVLGIPLNLNLETFLLV